MLEQLCPQEQPHPLQPGFASQRIDRESVYSLKSPVTADWTPSND